MKGLRLKQVFLTLIITVACGINLSAGASEKAPVKGIRDVTSIRGVYGLNPANEPVKKFLLSDPQIIGISLRAEWKLLQPGKDKFDWSYLDQEISKAKSAGKMVTLMVLPGIHSPEWLYANGARRFEFTDRNPHHGEKYRGEKATFGKRLSIPVPWDEKFLQEWERFVAALGVRYKEDPGIAIVHITGPNRHSAEMILPKEPEDKERWHSLGYSPGKLIQAWKRSIDAFANAFPNAYLSLNLSPVIFDDEVMEEVAKYGYEKYKNRFLLQNNALTASPNQRRKDFGLIKEYSSKTTVGFQMLAMATSKIDDRQGDLKQSIDNGLSLGAKYFEIYPQDIERLPEVIKYADQKLAQQDNTITQKQENPPSDISAISTKSSNKPIFVKVKGNKFILGDGSPFFLIGTNYRGASDRFANWWSDKTFDKALIDKDFSRAAKIGFNVLRIAIGKPLPDEMKAGNFSKIDFVVKTAEKYSIRLLITMYNYENVNFKEVIFFERKIAERYRDNPFIIGFDLLGEMHKDFFTKIAPKAKVSGKNENEILINWITPQIKAIREVNQNHLLTLGYGFMQGEGIKYAKLSANSLLDFISLHVYLKKEPSTNDILLTIRYGEELKMVWPNKPIIYEEFGYPNVQWIKDLKRNITHSFDDTANWEIATWLYLYTNDFGGGLKWQLTDFDLDSPFVKKEGEQHANFGLFTIKEEPKPIFYAARSLANYISLHPQAAGKLHISSDDKFLLRYIFRTPDSLFVSGNSYNSEGLTFSSDRITQIFLTYSNNNFTVQVTAPTRISINPGAFISSISKEKLKIFSKENNEEVPISFQTKEDWIIFNAIEGLNYIIQT